MRIEPDSRAFVNQILLQKKKRLTPVGIKRFKVGIDLLSHLSAVPSVLIGLTSLFGMGRGGTLMLSYYI